MKALGQILLYLAATVLIGALLAPPLFWMAHAAAAHLHSESLSNFVAKTEFQRYFDRGMTIAALALLWPLLKLLQIPDLNSLGLKPDRWGWMRLWVGLALALGGMAAMCTILYFSGIVRLHTHAPYLWLAWQIPLTAAVVSVLEEFLFRGALQGAIRKTTVDSFALVAVAFLFAAVHFLKPAGAGLAAADIHWWSGLALLPDTVWLFRQPAQLAGGFSTLLVAGLILGYARVRTRSLWLAIGMHAGWIIGEKGLMAMFRHTERWPWMGPDLPNTLVGLAPLLTLAVTWGVLALLLRDLRAK